MCKDDKLLELYQNTVVRCQELERVLRDVVTLLQLVRPLDRYERAAVERGLKRCKEVLDDKVG